jgi:EAL domain-containing protein (putative c-di-GMP-specific phosphodiesterase class I)
MLIRTIINLKDTYGIDIVAEGVETQVQSDILKDFGCMVHQGYLFSKPMPLI